MIRSFALVLALASFAGCKKSEESKAAPAAAKAQPAKAQPSANSGDTKALCVELFTRARACTNEYIPALVDARAKYDKPPGIAEAVKKDRNAVIQEALGEWKNDSTDASIGATCDKIAADFANAPQSDIDTARACLAKPDCASYTTCVMPLFEKRFAK